MASDDVLVSATLRPGRSARVVGVWIVWLLTVALVVLGVALGVPTTLDVVTIVTSLAWSLAAVSLVTVGALLATRLQGNPIGWLLWACGLLFSLALSLSTLPRSLPYVEWLAWLGDLAWVPAIVIVGILVPLYFPTGRLPSSRWRAVVAVGLVSITLADIQAALVPFGPGSAPSGVQNPLSVGGDLATLLDIGGGFATVAGIVCFPLAAASLVLRYRRAAGVERAQLRWLAAAVAATGLAFAVALLAQSPTAGALLIISNVAWLLLSVGLALLPIAIAIAVLRYRLYEIDRLISRSIGWAVLSVILAGAFTGVVLLLQAVLAPFTRSNELTVATSTLFVAALFQPIRGRVQRIVDRRFNRSRYDAERTLSAMAVRLRDEVDLEPISAELTAAVGRAVEPASVALWLRG